MSLTPARFARQLYEIEEDFQVCIDLCWSLREVAIAHNELGDAAFYAEAVRTLESVRVDCAPGA